MEGLSDFETVLIWLARSTETIDETSVRSSRDKSRVRTLGLWLLLNPGAREGRSSSVTVLSASKTVTTVDGIAVVSSGTLLESGTSSEMASMRDSVRDLGVVRDMRYDSK